MTEMLQKRRPLSLLLLDDDSVDVMALRRALNRAERRFDIEVVQDGIEALNKLEAADVKPDVLVLDLNMPRMNGLEFLAEYRRLGGPLRIPIFVLTTGAAEDDRRAAYALGITGYVLKAGSERLVKFAEFLTSYFDLVEPP